MAATAIALKPVQTLEDVLLESADAVGAGLVLVLSSLVLGVVRLIIIGGRVAVGGLARS